LLEGRIAVVTGAGSGLGRSHAKFLARQGAKLVVNDLDAAAAEAVVAEIVAGGGVAIACAGSVTDEAAVAVMAAQVMERFGRIDILVNNAGILRDKSFAKMSLDNFRLVVDVHLMGAVICTKAVWEIMRAQNYGRIVMTTSSSGLFGNFGQSNYGAAKMALVGLMQTLALEGQKYNICVNCLAPTAATAMTAGILDQASLDLLAPEKVSPALLALTSDDAPTRTILCAGAGHFAVSNITLTEGEFLGSGDEAGAAVIRQLEEVSSRTGDIVPQYGFTQAEREVASAQAASSTRGAYDCSQQSVQLRR
jgi:NAD(P)-dependent dehydrogenase (short-subunit alcohol dehydrogenase family)